MRLQPVNICGMCVRYVCVIITFYLEIHKEHINIVHRQSAELVNVKAGGTYSYHCAIMC